MTEREHFIATLQACYFGDRNAFNEIVSIYDNLQNKNEKAIDLIKKLQKKYGYVLDDLLFLLLKGAD